MKVYIRFTARSYNDSWQEEIDSSKLPRIPVIGESVQGKIVNFVEWNLGLHDDEEGPGVMIGLKDY